MAARFTFRAERDGGRERETRHWCLKVISLTVIKVIKILIPSCVETIIV